MTAHASTVAAAAARRARPAAHRASGRGAARAPEPAGQAQRDQRRAGRAAAHRLRQPAATTRARSCSAARASTSAPASTSSELSERSVAEGDRAFALVACRVRADPVRPRAGGRGAARRGGRRRARARRARRTSASPRRSAFYGLPEGQRGIFVGGGGSARIPRLIGAARMADMMLTGRVYDAEEGQRDRPVAVPGRRRAGPGQGVRAGRHASPPMRRCRTSRSCTRCRASPTWRQGEGLFVESLMAAIASGDAGRQAAHRAPSSKARRRRCRSRERRPSARRAPRALSRRCRSAARSRRRSTQRADGSTLVVSTRAARSRTPSA